MSTAVQVPPLNTPVTDHDGRLHPLWNRFFVKTQEVITSSTAPADAPYWIGSATAALTAARILALLASGYLKLTVGAGVAVPSTTTTLPSADLTGALPALDGSALTNLSASALASGTVNGARLPDPLPAVSGANLTALNASQLTSGTLPSARLGSPLPALNGSALTALTGVNVTHAVVTITAGMSPYTVTSADETVLVDATAGAVTVTLPSPTAGRILAVKKLDASANAVTLTGTIDGTVNPTLTVRYNAFWIQGDGSVFWLLGKV